MSYKTRKAVCLVKIESSYGVDASPGASDAVFLADLPEFTVAFEENANNELHAGLNKKLAGEMAGQHWDFKIPVYLRGPGTNTAGTPDAPSFDSLMQICHLERNGSGVYSPDSDSVKSATIYLFLDGKRFVGTGARANVAMAKTDGNKIMVTFTGKALYNEPTDVAPPTITDSEAPPIVIKSANCSAGTISVSEMKFSEFEFDMGNELTVDPDLNDANGIASIEITDRAPMVKINPRMQSTSEHNAYQELINGTASAFACTLGQNTDNTFIFAGTVQRKNMPLGDVNGIWHHEGLELAFRSNTDDGDFTITQG